MRPPATFPAKWRNWSVHRHSLAYGAYHRSKPGTRQSGGAGPIGMAVAIAVAEFLERAKLPGNVIVFGSPGEETIPPATKTQMYEDGIFKNIDVIGRSHAVFRQNPSRAGFGTCCLNIDGVKYTFSGAPAHQMTASAGRNALEGVIHLFENIDSIPEGGAAPNVVPDRAVADFYIRYPDAVYLAQVRQFIDNAARDRAAVKKEFTGIQALFTEYQEALKKVYPLPNVPDPR